VYIVTYSFMIKGCTLLILANAFRKEGGILHMHTNIQQDATMVSCFITRSLCMFRALSAPIIRSILIAVDSHWYNICYVGS
jgi:hypothetical protein